MALKPQVFSERYQDIINEVGRKLKIFSMTLESRQALRSLLEETYSHCTQIDWNTWQEEPYYTALQNLRKRRGWGKSFFWLNPNSRKPQYSESADDFWRHGFVVHIIDLIEIFIWELSKTTRHSFISDLNTIFEAHKLSLLCDPDGDIHPVSPEPVIKSNLRILTNMEETMKKQYQSVIAYVCQACTNLSVEHFGDAIVQIWNSIESLFKIIFQKDRLDVMKYIDEMEKCKMINKGERDYIKSKVQHLHVFRSSYCAHGRREVPEISERFAKMMVADGLSLVVFLIGLYERCSEKNGDSEAYLEHKSVDIDDILPF